MIGNRIVIEEEDKMVFSSIFFLCCFLPIMVILHNWIFKENIKWQNFVLLIGSLVFYAWGEPIFVFIMIVSIVVNYYTAIFMEQRRIQSKECKYILIINLIYNIGILVIFKYLQFIIENLGYVLKKDNISFKIALPIGISFFTFQIISYVIDVYNQRVKAQKNILDLALYISMFPQLVAGPIVRYESVEVEMRKRKVVSQNVQEGTYRFVYGLAKKILIADYLGLIVDNIFNLQENSEISVAMAWIGAVFYTLQIFFDFSGYSDMAIGLGKIFGFHFPENFDYPYIASSITEFWRRWHISLSSWFKDYVYIPLGGNRCTWKKHIFNLGIVWTLTGVWHGANWTFILWGMLYAVLLILEKYTNILKMPKWLRHLYTLFCVVLLWVIFRADSVGSAILYLKNMFSVGNYNLIDRGTLEYLGDAKWIVGIAVLFCTPIERMLIQNKVLENARVKKIYTSVKAICTLLIFVLTFSVCLKATYNPFIYFNF